MRTIGSIDGLAAGAPQLLAFGPFPKGSKVSCIDITMDKGATVADTVFLVGIASFAQEPRAVADFDSGDSFCLSSELIGDVPAVGAVRGVRHRFSLNLIVDAHGWIGVLLDCETDALSGTASVCVEVPDS